MTDEKLLEEVLKAFAYRNMSLKEAETIPDFTRYWNFRDEVNYKFLEELKALLKEEK